MLLLILIKPHLNSRQDCKANTNLAESVASLWSPRSAKAFAATQHARQDTSDMPSGIFRCCEVQHPACSLRVLASHNEVDVCELRFDNKSNTLWECVSETGTMKVPFDYRILYAGDLVFLRMAWGCVYMKATTLRI